MTSLFGIFAAVVYISLLLFKICRALTYLARNRERSEVAPTLESSEPNVTILQPLLSGDPQFETILRSNLENAPANVRFLWLIDVDDSQAIEVGEKAKVEFPGLVELLLCEKASLNFNPKSFKLALGLKHVHTEYLAVLDDDSQLLHDNIARALAMFEHSPSDTIDLYTGLPLFLPSPGVWSSLVSHFVNNNSYLTYLPITSLAGPVSLNGMFYLGRTEYFRKHDLFEGIAEKLCDDYALAQAIKSIDGRIHQGTTPLFLKVSISGCSHYFALMHRWFVFADVLVREQSWSLQLLLALMLGVPPLVLWLAIMSLVLSPWALWGIASLLVLRHVLLQAFVWLAVRIGVGKSAGSQTIWLNPIFSLVVELMQPVHYLHAKLVQRIRWRTRSITVHADGTFHRA